jgi:hypothetical protein
MPLHVSGGWGRSNLTTLPASYGRPASPTQAAHAWQLGGARGVPSYTRMVIAAAPPSGRSRGQS